MGHGGGVAAGDAAAGGGGGGVARGGAVGDGDRHGVHPRVRALRGGHRVGNFVVVDHDIFWSSDHPGIDLTVPAPDPPRLPCAFDFRCKDL